MPQAINFSTGISDAWSNVATFVPKFVVFLIILIVGYLVAKAIAKILSRVLTRVGFDRLVERGGVKAVRGHRDRRNRRGGRGRGATADRGQPRRAVLWQDGGQPGRRLLLAIGVIAARTAPSLSEQAWSYTTDQTRPAASGRAGASRRYPQEPGDPGRY